jgi:hypothetical protein
LKKPRIVLTGHVCIDRNTSEHTTYTGWGSTVLYAAQYFQNVHGIRPRVISRYGADFTPYAKEFLLYPEMPQEEKTQVNGNMPHGEGRIFQTFYSEHSGPPELDHIAKQYIAEADIVMLATLLPNYPPEFVKAVFELTKSDCLKVLSFQGYLRRLDDEGILQPQEFEGVDKILSYADAVVFSSEDHPRSVELAKGYAARLPKLQIVVTSGPEGATLFNDKTVTHVPTVPVPPEEIIDSVGCGDVFVAAFTYSLFQQGEVVEAIKEAHREARRKLFSSVGAQSRVT